MKLLPILLALVALATAERRHRSEVISGMINRMHTTWKAGTNLRFEGMPISQIKRMMGVREDEPQMRLRNLVIHDNEDITAAIPDTFDARKQWPKCAEVIENIRDQSACGSCWAVGAAGAMSDRMCIASDGQTKVSISAGDLMSCCMSCGFGCEGGYPHAAWTYFKNTGLVTGGNYTNKQGCQPYPLPPCEHHNNHTTYKPCPHSLYDTPKCQHKCTNADYTVSFTDDMHKAKTAYSISSAVEAIQKEIMTYGSVEMSFTVYEDFLTYKSGVYQHKTGGRDGGHAVRGIGWGTEDGTPYWLIANSWNTDWGDKGYFKILRGQDECGIEGGVVGGHV